MRHPMYYRHNRLKAQAAARKEQRRQERIALAYECASHGKSNPEAGIYLQIRFHEKGVSRKSIYDKTQNQAALQKALTVMKRFGEAHELHSDYLYSLTTHKKTARKVVQRALEAAVGDVFEVSVSDTSGPSWDEFE